MEELETELRRERENSNRLAATLEMLVGSLRVDDSTLHIVVGNPHATNHLTVGHVVDGALSLHADGLKKRIEI